MNLNNLVSETDEWVLTKEETPSGDTPRLEDNGMTHFVLSFGMDETEI